MDAEEMIKFLEKFDKGMFCTISFIITNSTNITKTVMFLGKDNDGIYNFFDNEGITGIFGLSKDFICQKKVTIDKKFDGDKAIELHSKLLLMQETKHKNNRNNRNNR